MLMQETIGVYERAIIALISVWDLHFPEDNPLIDGGFIHKSKDGKWLIPAIQEKDKVEAEIQRLEYEAAMLPCLSLTTGKNVETYATINALYIILAMLQYDLFEAQEAFRRLNDTLLHVAWQ